MSLSPAHRRTLLSLARRLVPLADDDPRAAELADAVAARIDALDAATAREAAALLAILEHPATTLLTAGRATPFSALPPDRADAALRGWEASRIPARRSLFQALRRLVLATWYLRDDARRDLGLLPPLHERAPAFAWEGPAPGEPRDDEPVARGAMRPVAPAPDGDPWTRGVTEGAALPDDTRWTADVVVIGSGAGGAVVAARLAAEGRDVVVLEEGALWRPAELTGRESLLERLYADGGARATRDLSITMLQGRAVGGGTLVNWMIMLPTPPHVLDEWADEHGTVGMRAADLAPHFARIEAETHTRPVPEDAHAPANRALLDGARALGWSVRPARINAEGCVRAGLCGLGCPHGAKRGAGTVHLPAALAAGARLVSDARVERIDVREPGRDGRKRVHATILDRATGRPRGTLTVDAPVVVLAAGAVGTPALLERSGMGGGGVGRFLRLHPTTVVTGRYAHETYPAAGIPLSAICDEFLRGDGDGYGWWVETPPYHASLAAAALPGFGAAHAEAMREARRSVSFIVLTRDGRGRDRSDGRVSVRRDGRVAIDYRVPPAGWARLRAGIEAGARIHFAAGASEVRTLHAGGGPVASADGLAAVRTRPVGPNRLGVVSAHVNGTCRLGTDPATGGCTPHGERHGWPGVYVADGSLLPTAPGVNPQETIMALASVVAARIAARHPARAGAAGAPVSGAPAASGAR